LRSARLLKIEVQPEAIKIIAQAARATPRVANRLLKRARDFAQVKGDGAITGNLAKEAMAMLEVDELGLEPLDRQILLLLIEKFGGGPAGLQALAAATSEEQDTLEDIYEPYLMQLGFIMRTSRGRVATRQAYEHLGLKYPDSAQNKLL